MTPVAAAAILAAAASFAQTAPRASLEAPTALFPVLPAAAVPVERPLGLTALVGGSLLGTPAPGLTPASVGRLQALAERSGLPLFVDEKGKVGVVAAKDVWDGRRTVLPTVEEAVGKGHFVVEPPKRSAEGDLGLLQRLSRPQSTALQLSKLQRTRRGDGESFDFAVIGDAEPGRFWFSRGLFGRPGVFARLLRAADAAGPDFIFQMGDMVSRGTVERFREFVWGLIEARLRAPYLTAIGNHDRHKPHGITHDRVYRAVMGATDYVFDRGGWRFVVVDSSAGRVTKPQLDWLESQLDPDVPTVVFTHMPPAPLGHWTDWGALKGAGGFKEGSARFVALMEKYKVKRVYMGHIHALDAHERNGVRYVLTGGGGSPLFPGPGRKLHHWLSVSVGPEGLVETVHADDGSTFPL